MLLLGSNCSFILKTCRAISSSLFLTFQKLCLSTNNNWQPVKQNICAAADRWRRSVCVSSRWVRAEELVCNNATLSWSVHLWKWFVSSAEHTLVCVFTHLNHALIFLSTVTTDICHSTDEEQQIAVKCQRDSEENHIPTFLSNKLNKTREQLAAAKEKLEEPKHGAKGGEACPITGDVNTNETDRRIQGL